MVINEGLLVHNSEHILTFGEIGITFWFSQTHHKGNFVISNFFFCVILFRRVTHWVPKIHFLNNDGNGRNNKADTSDAHCPHARGFIHFISFPPSPLSDHEAEHIADSQDTIIITASTYLAHISVTLSHIIVIEFCEIAIRAQHKGIKNPFHPFFQ